MSSKKKKNLSKIEKKKITSKNWDERKIMTLNQKKKKTLDLYLLNKFKIEKKNNWTRLLCGSEILLNFIFNREKNSRTIR